jgi:hypothetical protein
MTWASDQLRTFITNVPIKVAEIDASLVGIQEQIDILTDLQTAINDGVLDEAVNLMVILLEAKRVALGATSVRTFGDFGILDLTEFLIYTITGANFAVELDGFSVDTDLTGTYTAGKVIASSSDGSGTVISSDYNITVPLKTYVATALSVSAHAGPVNYEYLGTGWDSDADILAAMDGFDEGYDHLTRLLSGSATYGIDDMIAKLNIGKNIQTNNKAKLETVETVYEPFAT